MRCIIYGQVYDQSLERALLELGLDARGVAATEGWEVDSALLRSLLRRLRGICTHPQVQCIPSLYQNFVEQDKCRWDSFRDQAKTCTSKGH